MKKKIIWLLIVILSFGIISCGNNAGNEKPENEPEKSEEVFDINKLDYKIMLYLENEDDKKDNFDLPMNELPKDEITSFSINDDYYIVYRTTGSFNYLFNKQNLGNQIRDKLVVIYDGKIVESHRYNNDNLFTRFDGNYVREDEISVRTGDFEKDLYTNLINNGPLSLDSLKEIIISNINFYKTPELIDSNFVGPTITIGKSNIYFIGISYSGYSISDIIEGSYFDENDKFVYSYTPVSDEKSGIGKEITSSGITCEYQNSKYITFEFNWDYLSKNGKHNFSKGNYYLNNDLSFNLYGYVYEHRNGWNEIYYYDNIPGKITKSEFDTDMFGYQGIKCFHSEELDKDWYIYLSDFHIDILTGKITKIKADQYYLQAGM